jgi:hypothetical protein
MGMPEAVSKVSRVRASERASRLALTAMIDAGLTVQKVCLSGAQIEIHCVNAQVPSEEEEDDGLEKW